MKKFVAIIACLFVMSDLVVFPENNLSGTETKGINKIVMFSNNEDNNAKSKCESNVGEVSHNLFNPQVSDENHSIGDEYMDGVIFHIYIGSDGKQHGLVVSKTETVAQWQTKASLVNANKRNLGVYNTNLMTNSPAKDWVKNLGPDWYLPSLDELGALYKNKSQVNKTLRAKGYTPISSGFYWSSTEYDTYNANNVDFADGTGYYYVKTKSYKVRGIRAF